MSWRGAETERCLGVGCRASPLGDGQTVAGRPPGVPPAAAAAAAAAATAASAAARSELRVELFTAAAATCRGQCGSPAEREGVLQLVEALEGLNPTTVPVCESELLQGDWALVFASEDVTRSSPFFWGWRRLLTGVPDPLPLTRAMFGTDQLSESIFAITDGLPMKTVGAATQHIRDGELVNRVTLNIFGLGEAKITTTCAYNPAENDRTALDLAIKTTQAVNSSLPLADTVKFPSKLLLGENANVVMHVTYLDESLRVSRNLADGQFFVYARVV
eukprot:CAMPEP_0117540540 /NCGR_PEP_ID=MMETSP0784-20121206/43553_1 /TAXON_ID=39447 /ORGANISM="" /LENGTH=274 /DNA_ID=CAMNT_0005337201 /DNA_START=38 /DNA_END=862 /DNA_ORIENTATION=+